jgi:chloramphenicol O-acetyltransferase
MSVTNQNQETDDDSLRVEIQDDGSMTIYWDECDSRYTVLNTMTEEQLTAMIVESLQKKLKESENV